MSFLKQYRIPGIVAVAGLSFFLFFFRLGDRSFRNPDEGRYAEIAREMVQSGDWTEPRLYGVDYLRKPVLFYWMVAASFKLFGFTELAARMVPSIFGILGILAVYVFARRVFGGRSALFSSLLLLSNLWYLAVGRYLLMDMVFSFFVAVSLGFFYLGTTEKTLRAKFYFIFFYIFAALAFLTKGLAGVVLPGLTIAFYLVWTRQFRAVIPRMSLPAGAAIFGAIALPWFVAISRQEPEFLSFFFLHEHLKRYVSNDFEHQQAWYYYFLILPGLFVPWIFFKKPMNRSFAFLREGAADRPRVFLLVSTVSVVLFYSFSQSKLLTYILPAIFFLSVLIGDGWSRWEHRHVRKIFLGTVAFFCAVSMGIAVTMENVNHDYTTKPFAETLKTHLKGSGESVFIYDNPGAFYDFEFYLGRPVKLVGLEGELELARGDEEVKEASITHERFKEILDSTEKIYCLMRKSDYLGWDIRDRQRVLVLKEDKRKVLIVNSAALPHHRTFS